MERTKTETSAALTSPIMGSTPTKPKKSVREWIRRLFRRSPKSEVEMTIQEPQTPPYYDAPSPRTNLSKTEKDMILQATKHAGQWFKCGQGHPYLVGACGYPTELSSCPTCGDRIGSSGHFGRVHGQAVKSAF